MLTRSLSLLTPVLPSRAAFLPMLGESVEVFRSLAMAKGWAVDWVVVQDGPGHVEPPSGSNFIRLPQQVGVAGARNYGLVECAGAWVAPFDADDLVDTEASELLDRLGVSADVGWVSGNRRFVDGAPTPHFYLGESVWPEWSVAESWTSPFPFHPNSILVRKELLLRAGGWPALPANEDIGLVFAVSALAVGESWAPTLTRYRIWPEQTVQGEAYLANKARSFEFITAVENARRASAGRHLVEPPPVGSTTPGVQRPA